MTSDPLETVAEVSALIAAELRHHPGIKFPTCVLQEARKTVTRRVREEAYWARKKLERVHNDNELLTAAIESKMIKHPAAIGMEDTQAFDALEAWIAHLDQARIRATAAKRAEAKARYELWQELATICDEYLGFGPDDCAFE